VKIMIYVGHPSQYLFFRESIRKLKEKGNSVLLLIKTKDILEDIIIQDGFEYINIMPKPRGNSKFSIGWNLLVRLVRILPLIMKEQPDLMIGGDATISQLGWLLRKNRFTLTEDDYPVIKTLADITFPFSQAIVSPKVCNVGKWSEKKIGYDGYMKLAYLHPDVFHPKKETLYRYNINEPYVLIRLAKLTAHHDFGIKGIGYNDLKEIIGLIEEKNISVFISSEADLTEEFKKYELIIDPSDMHHILAYSKILISDSQSMSVEASMLGVPSIRFSDFAGRISVLEELEHTYELTFGISTDNFAELIRKLKHLLTIEELNELFSKRKQRMLSDKINVSKFITWFIEEFPNSMQVMRENPDFQYRFK